jgi:hypothetical protein
LLYSNEGRCFTPGYTRKKDKFYRYYINTDAIKIGPKSCEIQRLPAGDIESVITAKVKEILQTPEVTAAAVRTTGHAIDWASDGMATLITQTVRPKDDLQEAA